MWFDLSLWMLLALALSLSLDALAVSVANGIKYRDGALKTALACAFFFGVFQAVMPMIGYYAGFSFIRVAQGVGRWLALILLSVVGGRMIWSALRPEDSQDPSKAGQALSLRPLIVQAFATSIDALAVGVGLSAADIDIIISVAVIGAVTFLCCFSGFWAGRFFGAKFSGKAEIAGGIVLILIGIRIFMDSGV